jgi:hypothetical protein
MGCIVDRDSHGLLDPALSYLSIDHLSIHLIPSILGSNLELKYPVFLLILAACLFSSRTPRLEVKWTFAQESFSFYAFL